MVFKRVTPGHIWGPASAVLAFMVRPLAVLLVYGCIAASAVGVALADPVVLRTKDGSFQLDGDLLEFDGKTMTVRTSMGTIKIPANEVECTGVGCPEGTGPAVAETKTTTTETTDLGPVDKTELVLAVEPNLPGWILEKLIRTYSDESGVTVTRVGDDGAWNISNGDGSFRLLSDSSAVANLEVATLADAQAASSDKILVLDTIVAVTAPGSRPSALTLETLADIFSGAITDWSSVNARGGAIVPVMPADDTLVDGIVGASILGGKALGPNVVRTDDIQSFLLSTPGAVALVRGSAKGALRPTPLAGSCGLTSGVDSFSVKSGQYPLVHRVALRTGPGELKPQVRRFLDFVIGERGQNAFRGTTLVGQSIVRASKDWQADWIASAVKLSQFVGDGAASAEDLQRLVETTSRASRLSPTLRYSFDTETPDGAALGDFKRLADAIDSGIFDGNEFIFVGFTDGGTSVAAGRSLSSNAANRALRDFGAAYPAALGRPRIRFTAEGFGGIAPLACSTSRAERAVNQRVEIWIRPL